MRNALLSLLVAAGAVTVYLWTQKLDGLRLAEALSEEDTTASVQSSTAWRFADRDRPLAGRTGIGRPQAWGNWRVVDGVLELDASAGASAAYFLPLAHEAAFRLTTDVQITAPSAGERAVVYVGTRRAAPDTLTGTAVGLSIAPRPPASVATGGCGESGADAVPVSIWHFIMNRKIVSAACASPIDDGSWHRVSLDVGPNGLAVSVDGAATPFLNLADRAADHAPATIPLLAGRYDQPYVAVQGGTARFRYLEVGPPGSAAPAVATSAPRTGGGGTGAVALPGADAGVAGGTFGDPAPDGGPVDQRAWWVLAMLYTLYSVIFLVCVYMTRHYLFTINRLFGRQRHPYLDIDAAEWPPVTVLIPAHNEESVIGDILDALLHADYPADKLRVVPVNDRSDDRTGVIIDRFAARYPRTRLTPFHRRHGHGGKAAVLFDAMAVVDDDIVLVFDADYYPGRGLIKQLVAPFFDPEVGAVMGRVVPSNVGRNLLTRMLDLERAGGYQVNQQARMNLSLVPQFGGTVGGVRRQALDSAGGWRGDSLAEDTDATMRLLLAGWKTVYQNRSECYEQVPDTWRARMRQLSRWARGHTQVLVRYGHRVLLNRRTTLKEKIDGVLLLLVYMMSPVLLVGWTLALALWFLGVAKLGVLVVLLVAAYSGLGNFATFSEIAAATYLDGSRSRIRLLPFMMPCFVVSVFVVTWALISQLCSRRNGGAVVWHKTERSGREK